MKKEVLKQFKGFEIRVPPRRKEKLVGFLPDTAVDVITSTVDVKKEKSNNQAGTLVKKSQMIIQERLIRQVKP
jgi:hypothetical protein